jgi:DNA-binding NarL/FixJ family response regulator
MDETCRVFLIGDSLFVETLAQLLADESWVTVTGTAVSPEAALPTIATDQPHLIILAYAGSQPGHSPDPLLDHYADIPVICADLNHDYVQVITSRRVSARRADLLAAIAEIRRTKDELRITKIIPRPS